MYMSYYIMQGIKVVIYTFYTNNNISKVWLTGRSWVIKHQTSAGHLYIYISHNIIFSTNKIPILAILTFQC